MSLMVLGRISAVRHTNQIGILSLTYRLECRDMANYTCSSGEVGYLEDRYISEREYDIVMYFLNEMV
jgi:hypothetical protein